VNAIHLDTNVSLDDKACVACGLCLHNCPVGAYTGDDGVTDLFELVTRFPDTSLIELACSRHPVPAQGAVENAVVIQTQTCLAALGSSRYFQLMTRVPQVCVRMDACAECPIGRAQKEIARAINAARDVVGDRVVGITEKPGVDAKTRSVYDTKNPPVSRRDLFRFFAVEGSKVANRILSSDNEQAIGKAPPSERRRLINALKQLASAESMEWQNASVAELGVLWLEADEKCTACGVCARACPTGAMQFTETQNNQYHLALTVSQCTNCGVCIDICEPTALRRAGAPTLAELVASESRVLRAGGLKKCNRCNAQYDDQIEGNLCPICRYRIDHPFGSRLPQVAKLRAK
jgi:ferredoxin